MDSFYDVPRHAPRPIVQTEKFLPSPVVPEVSIIGATKTPTNKFTSYSSWKMQQHTAEDSLLSQREHLVKACPPFNQVQCVNPQNTSQLLKKQVRFESPTLQQRPSLTYESVNRKKITQNDMIGSKESVKTCEKPNLLQKNDPSSIRNFEQMYLSNIPHRHLDLSLIDISNKLNEKGGSSTETVNQIKQMDSNKIDLTPVEVDKNSCEDKENMLPKTYKEFLETQKKVVKRRNEDLNDSVTDIFNYKRQEFNRSSLGSGNVCKPVNKNSPTSLMNKESLKRNSNGIKHVERQQIQPPFCENNQYRDFRQPGVFKNFGHSPKCDRVTQTSIAPENRGIIKSVEAPKNDSEPSNRDLLKIIAQQNEQLLILQRQVAMLLNKEQHQCKQIEPPHTSQKTNYVGEKCITSTQNEIFGRNSLQDASNTPKKRPLSKFSIDLMTSFEVAIRPQHKPNFVNHEPKIQEITESEGGASSVDKCDKTLVDSSLHLQEPVNVREMCPSPEPSININMNDYDSSDDDEVSVSEIGATFYNNLMGQVNNILRKAHVQTQEDFRDREKCVDRLKNQTMNKVKQATLKHLRNIGVTVGPIENSDEEASSGSDGKNYSPTEISFAVKQLLMKYLPDEQLAKISYKQAQRAPQNKAGKCGIIPARPDFSFASLEYMKKYNLMSNKDVKPKECEQIPKITNTQQKPDGPKILDLTALKLQPKLL